MIAARGLAAAAPAGVVLALALAGARVAQAQSFVQRVSDDACEQIGRAHV